VITLSLRDWEALMEALQNPGPPSPKLLEASKRYLAFIGEE
jgi:uncharacterized protein (DUF1778 family)